MVEGGQSELSELVAAPSETLSVLQNSNNVVVATINVFDVLSGKFRLSKLF